MPSTSMLMIAASASNLSVMFIDSSGTHSTWATCAEPGEPGQLSTTQISEPSGTRASG